MSPQRNEPVVASLERILNSAPRLGPVLPLPACLEEMDASLRDPRLTRVDQRRSLVRDVHASAKDIGAKLKSTVATSLEPLLKSATVALSTGKPSAAETTAALVATEQLVTALRTPDAMQAAWRDLVTALRNGLKLETVLQRLRLLLSVAESADRDSDQLRLDLHSIVAGDFGGPPWTAEQPQLSADERLAACEELVARPAEKRLCIAWVAFEGTIPNSRYLPAEPIVFYQSAWAVPNARLADGQDFPHSEELGRLVDSIPDALLEPTIVLVRVDLGQRAAAGALAEGWRQAALLVGRAVLRVRGRPWKRIGWNVLIVDDNAYTEHFATKEQLDLGPNSHERRAVASALAEIAPATAKEVSRLPTQLHEAVDTALEATGAELRSQVVLRFRVIELLASYLEVSEPEDLLKQIRCRWAFGEVQHGLNSTIYFALKDRRIVADRDEQDLLSRAILKPVGMSGDVVVDYDEASAGAEALVAIARCGVDQVALRDALTLAANGPAFARRVEETARIEELLASRLQRVRNAITHGNPFTLAAAASIENYLTYVSELLVDEAFEAAVDGRVPMELLRERGAELRAIVGRLKSGTSLARVFDAP